MLVMPRPGHADYTYQLKYGLRASSGGGRSSARETIGRVASGAIAEKWLRETFGTEIVCFVSAIGDVEMPEREIMKEWTRKDVDERGKLQLVRGIARDPIHGGDVRGQWTKVDDNEAQAKLDARDEKLFLESSRNLPAYYAVSTGKVYKRDGELELNDEVIKHPVFGYLSDDLVSVRCPHAPTAAKMASLVRKVKSEHDSIGGVVTCVIRNVPVGLGEPCFDKLEAKLAHAMLSLPATKGFEIGSGFRGTRLRGSQHNDAFISHDEGSPLLSVKTNNAGGTLGGISSGAEIVFRVAVKPVSTIGRAQKTATFSGEMSELRARGRHDPCVLPRTPPLIEGMAALVIADAALIQRSRAAAGDSLVLIHDEKTRAKCGLPCAEPMKKRANEISSHNGACDTKERAAKRARSIGMATKDSA